MLTVKSIRTPSSQFGLSLLAASVLAFVLVAGSFLLQARIGLNLADEGFLWHGAMRVLAGDVPVRDFQSYDPGRYYWSALWMRLQGSDGVVALRRSVALFQVGALTVGLLLLRRVASRPASLALMALVFLLWFFPRHKLFDLSLSIWAVAVGARLIESPSVSRHFLAGLFIGLAAVFGRNHAVYALVALSTLAAFAWARLDRSRPLAKTVATMAGIGTGYVPILLLAATQPGFADAMIDGVLGIFRHGTNLSIPVPWPWAVDYRVAWPWAMHRFLVGATFVAMPVLYVLGSIAVLRERRPEAIRRDPVFVSSLAFGLVYMHYAYSRADVGHLAHAIFPFLFALFSAPLLRRSAVRERAALAVPLALLAYSLLSVAVASPLYSRIVGRDWVEIDVRGDTLIVDPATARAVQTVQSIARRYMQSGDEIVFSPYWPTMYAILGRVAPVWETYSSYAEDAEGQRRFIEELEAKRVKWAVVGNAPLDGREDRRFSQTHPNTWRYFEENYEPVEIQGLPADYRLLRRRSANEPDLQDSRALPD